MTPSYVYSLLAYILRAGENLILVFLTLYYYIPFISSMEPSYVHSLLTDMLRASESLIIDL